MSWLRKLLSPWRAAEALEAYHDGVQELIRDILHVTRVQAETTREIQGALAAIATLYITSEEPESRNNDEDARLLAEMLASLSKETQKGH